MTFAVAVEIAAGNGATEQDGEVAEEEQELELERIEDTAVDGQAVGATAESDRADVVANKVVEAPSTWRGSTAPKRTV